VPLRVVDEQEVTPVIVSFFARFSIANYDNKCH
jgi:hypothetical protein